MAVEPTCARDIDAARILQMRHSMEFDKEVLKARTKKFALDFLGFVRTLANTDECRDIGDQLRRSGTGVGANYRATCRSRCARNSSHESTSHSRKRTSQRFGSR